MDIVKAWTYSRTVDHGMEVLVPSALVGAPLEEILEWGNAQVMCVATSLPASMEGVTLLSKAADGPWVSLRFDRRMRPDLSKAVQPVLNAKVKLPYPSEMDWEEYQDVLVFGGHFGVEGDDIWIY